MSEEKQKRGFASLSPERLHEISVRGGKAAHAQGKAHKFNSVTGHKAAMKSLINRKKAE